MSTCDIRHLLENSGHPEVNFTSGIVCAFSLVDQSGPTRLARKTKAHRAIGMTTNDLLEEDDRFVGTRITVSPSGQEAESCLFVVEFFGLEKASSSLILLYLPLGRYCL
jgi:hypothetical protein